MEKDLKESELYLSPLGRQKSGGYGFYIFLAVLLCCMISFRMWWTNTYSGVVVSGASMRQTLQSGDALLMKRVNNGEGLKRGDVIVVDVTGYDECGDIDYLIKRLIAMEGDKVKCLDGQISICYAGTSEWVKLQEPYAYYQDNRNNYDFGGAEYTVGEGEIFFLGDNRQNSIDSRYQETNGSHLADGLYKATDVFGIVPEWAIQHKNILEKIFFKKSIL